MTNVSIGCADKSIGTIPEIAHGHDSISFRISGWVGVVQDLGSDRYDLPPGAANLRHEASFALQRVARVA
jgi:hypothetical protein